MNFRLSFVELDLCNKRKIIMNHRTLPEKIKELTANKGYTINNIGMSESTVITFDDMVLKIEKQSKTFDHMLQMMKWLEGKVPVPKIICCEKQGEMNYLLMSKVTGKMSCDEYYLERPQELVTLLAEGLMMLWDVDISDCPNVQNLDIELAEAQYRVEHNLVDIERAEPETFGEHGFENPSQLLKWLKENRPKEEAVLSHGDFCLPNVFIDNGKISGFIDLGDAGIGDKWRDISLCYRSLKHNFDGTFGSKVYKDFSPDILFEKLNMKPNWEKLRYYILLDELF